MEAYKRLISSVRTPHLVSVTGVLLLAGFAVLTAMMFDGSNIGAVLENLLLIAVPALIMLYVSYWLPKSDIHPETYIHITKWFMRGIISLNSILIILLLFVEVTGVRGVLQQALFFTSIGGTAGLGIGYGQAKAYTKTKEVEERNRELEEFNNLVSHDLKNPLNNAKAFIQLAKNSEDKQDIQKVEESIEQARRVLDEIESLPLGSEKVEKVEVELEDAFKQACEDAGSEVDCRAEETTIYANQRLLVRLLSKLIENSIQHNEKKVTVKVGALENCFYYEDNGKGITDEEREKVLEKGYTTSGTGQGLGLYIVKRIADAHSWDINVTESGAGGARFEFHN